MSEFEAARNEWDAEVSRVAAGLVRNGTPPGEAYTEASRMVAARRRSASRVSPGPKLIKSLGDFLKTMETMETKDV